MPTAAPPRWIQRGSVVLPGVTEARAVAVPPVVRLRLPSRRTVVAAMLLGADLRAAQPPQVGVAPRAALPGVAPRAALPGAATQAAPAAATQAAPASPRPRRPAVQPVGAPLPAARANLPAAPPPAVSAAASPECHLRSAQFPQGRQRQTLRPAPLPAPPPPPPLPLHRPPPLLSLQALPPPSPSRPLLQLRASLAQPPLPRASPSHPPPASGESERVGEEERKKDRGSG